MVKRIVKMTFKPESVDVFIDIFERYRQHIRAAEGCVHLELWRQEKEGNVFFTYSHWEHPDFLEKYRQSAVFAEVWPQTKALFADKPEAWTVDMLVQLA